MLKSSEDSYFSQGSLTVSLVLEWAYLLYSNNLPQLSILCRADKIQKIETLDSDFLKILNTELNITLSM